MKPDELFEIVATKIKQSATTDDPDVLIGLLRDLGSLHHSFGQIVAEARRARDDADTHLKVMREQIKLSAMDSGVSGTKADALRIVETEDEALELNRHAYRYELIRSYREDIEKAMDAIRSTLSYIKYDRDAAKTQL